MSPVSEFVSGLSPGRRMSLGAGLLLIVGLCAGLYMFAYRSHMEPLYTDLADQDAAKVIAQLDEMKVAHALSPDGKSILVDSSVAGETRLRIDGSNLGMNGGQGFELFDDADYGMTEFVQKINYQRALQGEIARTVMGLGVVRQARVHLVLPDHGLFEQSQTVAKASVSVVQEPQRLLNVSQIAGIQHLVASAVDGMDVENVTVIDERGVVLTQPRAQDRKGGGANLGRKQEIEEYLTQKAASILDQLYDPGVAVVNIDVTLGNEQVQLTRETYNSPEKSGQGGIAAKSRTQRKFSGGAEGNASESRKQLASEVVETDYRVDRSVEQVVKGEGAIERMTVSVMVPRTVDVVTLKAIRQLVANAVGLRESRGDAIEVSSLPVAPAAVSMKPVSGDAPVPAGVPRAPALQTAPKADAGWGFSARALLVALVLALLGALYYAFSRRAPVAVPELPASEREALLRDVKRWFEDDAASAPDAPDTATGAG